MRPNSIVLFLANLNSKTFKDTVNLPDGCYTFTMDDDGCDGLSWWAYQYYTPNPGNGSIRFVKLGIPVVLKNFNGDFGCQTSERFMTSSAVTSLEKNKMYQTFQLFPNPAISKINLQIEIADIQELSCTITDITGKEIKAIKLGAINSDTYAIDVDDLSNGMYFLTCKFEKGGVMTQKFVIRK